MPTPWEWNSRILREQEAALAQVEAQRQRDADDRARRAVVGDEDGAGETDGPGFWSKVRELASQAWGERGAVFKWGAASALDEIAQTTKDVGAQQSARIDAIGERMGVAPRSVRSSPGGRGWAYRHPRPPEGTWRQRWSRWLPEPVPSP